MSTADDELLRRVALGELPPDAREVAAAAARDPELARAIAELREVQHGLDAAARERALDLAAAEAVRLPDSEARVRAQVLAHVADRRRARRRRGLLAAAVVVVAVACFLLARRPVDPDLRTSPMLGGDPEIQLERPIGVQGYERFAWRSDRTTGSFRVRVESEDGREWRSPFLEEQFWVPDSTETDPWPDRIWWCVEWYDASPDVRAASSGAWASRQSR